MSKSKQEYAIYKGDTILDIGTADELATRRNVNKKTIYHLSRPSYKKLLKKRKNNKNALIVIKINEQGECF